MTTALRRTLHNLVLTAAIVATSFGVTYVGTHAYAAHTPYGSAIGMRGGPSVYTYNGTLNAGVGVDPGPFVPCLGFEVRGVFGPFIDREC